MRDELERIFNEYAAAREESFRGHALARFIRGPLAEAFRDATAANFSELVWQGSAGAGNWAVGPWLATFDPAITTSAQRGFYPVFLFSAELDAVYWSMNQGVTDLRREFSASVTRRMLEQRASRLRARAGIDLPDRFNTNAIELQPPSSSHLLAFYEAGHAFGPWYARGDLPSDDQLLSDVGDMLRLYRLLSARGGTDDLEIADEEPTVGDGKAALEGARRYRYHVTLERSAALAKQAKTIHGGTCQCCGYNFEAVFGELGKGYIEAHHLVPLSQLDGDEPVPRSPKDDFRVLCANCHRMIHRMIREIGEPVTVESLRGAMVEPPS